MTDVVVLHVDFKAYIGSNAGCHAGAPLYRHPFTVLHTSKVVDVIEKVTKGEDQDLGREEQRIADVIAAFFEPVAATSTRPLPHRQVQNFLSFCLKNICKFAQLLHAKAAWVICDGSQTFWRLVFILLNLLASEELYEGKQSVHEQ